MFDSKTLLYFRNLNRETRDRRNISNNKQYGKNIYKRLERDSASFEQAKDSSVDSSGSIR